MNSLKTILNGQKRWFGNSDHRTKPQCFWTGPKKHPAHLTAMVNVLAVLTELVQTHEVQLIWWNPNSPQGQVIAFRYTADENYENHHANILRVAAGLGRGSFRPFCTPTQTDFKNFVTDATTN